MTLTRNVPLESEFAKSGGFVAGTPDSDFIEWYLTGGQPLTLKPGTWHLFVLGHFNEGECGGDEADMRATVSVVVEDGPLSATHSSGDFRLTLNVPRTVYNVGEQVEATAVIEHLGDGQQVISAGQTGLVGFGAARGHGDAVTPRFDRRGCATTATLSLGQPVTVPFQVDSRAMRWEPGLYEVAAVTDFAPSDDCSGPRLKLRAVVAIEIRP